MKSLSKIALVAALAVSSAMAPAANAVIGIVTLPTAPVVGGVEIALGAVMIASGTSATVVRCHRRPYRGPRRPGRTVCTRQAVGGGMVALGLLLLDEQQGYIGAQYKAPSADASIQAGLTQAEASAVAAEELKIQMIDDEVNSGAKESWDSIAQATLSAEAYSGIKKIQLAATQQ